jgi:hypothetical protein
MFFFPLPQGNFQSTHGPVSALRSNRAVLVLLSTLISAAFQIVAFLVPTAVLVLGRRLLNSIAQPEICDLNSHNSVLRC